MTAETDEKTYALFSTSANKKLIGELEKKRLNFFVFPPLVTEQTRLDQTENQYLQEVESFDWIVFTDIFAVEYFLENLRENEIDPFRLDAVKVCAFGEAVSDRLRFAELHADVLPDLIETETIITALANYLYGEELKDLRILVVKEVSRKSAIVEKLNEKGAAVFEFSVYKTTVADKIEAVKLKTLLKSGAIDEFVFSAAQDFFSIQYYLSGEVLTDIFSKVKVSARNENAFQTAKEFGLRPLYFHI